MVRKFTVGFVQLQPHRLGVLQFIILFGQDQADSARSVFHEAASLRIEEVWKSKVLFSIYGLSGFYFSISGTEEVIEEQVGPLVVKEHLVNHCRRKIGGCDTDR